MNVKISQKHDNMYYIRNNYTLKSIYDYENECNNYTLSVTIFFFFFSTHLLLDHKKKRKKCKNILYGLLHASQYKFLCSLKTHKDESKKFPNSPILSFNQEFNSIMVNQGRIHGEIANFLGILKI